jgi:hypothetical protein
VRPPTRSDDRRHIVINRPEKNPVTTSSMSTLKSVGESNSSESKGNDATPDVALGALSECVATRSTGKKGEKLLDRTWWPWTTCSEYDWMDKHSPFNDRD